MRVNLIALAVVAAIAFALYKLTGDAPQWGAYGLGIYAVFSWIQSLRHRDRATYNLIWGSPIVIDGKVYLGDEDGDVAVMNADRTMKLIAESNTGSSVYSTPVPANGTLYIVNRNQLLALAEGAGGTTAAK